MVSETQEALSAEPAVSPEMSGIPIGDPIDELASAVDCRIQELINTHLQMILTGAAVPLDTVLNLPGRQRLHNAIGTFHDWSLETRLGLEQLRKSKTKPSGKDTLIAGRINGTLRRLGCNEEWVRRFWSEFYSEGGPDQEDAQRQAASRAARAAEG